MKSHEEVICLDPLVDQSAISALDALSRDSRKNHLFGAEALFIKIFDFVVVGLVIH